GPGDPVVHIDVRVIDGPALRRGEGPGVLDLPSDRALLVRDSALVGGLAGVDGGDHGVLGAFPHWTWLIASSIAWAALICCSKRAVSALLSAMASSTLPSLSTLISTTVSYRRPPNWRIEPSSAEMS